MNPSYKYNFKGNPHTLWPYGKKGVINKAIYLMPHIYNKLKNIFFLYVGRR